jgi:hypothetical protein
VTAAKLLLRDVAPCSLVEVERRFRGGAVSIIRAIVMSWKYAPPKLPRDYTALHPRKLLSLYRRETLKSHEKDFYCLTSHMQETFYNPLYPLCVSFYFILAIRVYMIIL